MDFKDAFMTKIGPLPAIAWAGMAGGAFVLFKYATQKNDSPSVSVIPDSVPDYATGGVGTSDDFSDGYGNAYYTGSSAPPTGVMTQPTQAVQTNMDWGRRAADWLIAMGINPTDAQYAISAFLYGSGELNTTQQSALNSALRQFGTPPEGVAVPPPVSTPTQTPAAPAPTAVTPKKVHRYNGGPDGPNSFVALIEYSDGSIGWISNGAEYSPLVNQYGEQVHSAASITTLVVGKPKKTGPPTPGYLPSTAQAAW